MLPFLFFSLFFPFQALLKVWSLKVRYWLGSCFFVLVQFLSKMFAFCFLQNLCIVQVVFGLVKTFWTQVKIQFWKVILGTVQTDPKWPGLLRNRFVPIFWSSPNYFGTIWTVSKIFWSSPNYFGPIWMVPKINFQNWILNCFQNVLNQSKTTWTRLESLEDFWQKYDQYQYLKRPDLYLVVFFPV